MACPVCSTDNCTNAFHRLPRELFNHVLSLAPLPPTAPLVSREWYEWAAHASFVEVPSGPHVAIYNPFSSFLSFSFRVVALFRSHPNGLALLRSGQYRQYVRGQFHRNGRVVAHSLPFGLTLSPVQFQLDGPPGTRRLYGERSDRVGRANFYGASREAAGRRGAFDEHGAHFVCLDDPGVSGQPGDVVSMHLEFRGILIDTATQRILGSSEWSVSGVAIIPTLAERQAMQAAAAAKRKV